LWAPRVICPTTRTTTTKTTSTVMPKCRANSSTVLMTSRTRTTFGMPDDDVFYSSTRHGAWMLENTRRNCCSCLRLAHMTHALAHTTTHMCAPTSPPPGGVRPIKHLIGLTPMGHLRGQHTGNGAKRGELRGASRTTTSTWVGRHRARLVVKSNGRRAVTPAPSWGAACLRSERGVFPGVLCFEAFLNDGTKGPLGETEARTPNPFCTARLLDCRSY